MSPGPSRRRPSGPSRWDGGRLALLALPLALAGVVLMNGCRAENSETAGGVASEDDPRGDFTALDRGEAVYRSGDFPAAVEVFSAAADSLAAAADSAGLAVAWTWLGLGHWQLGAYPDALRFGEGALALKERLGMDDELARSLNALGLLAWSDGRLAEAVNLHERSLQAARAVGDETGEARSLNNLALVHADQGDPGLAVARYREAAEAFQRLDLPQFQGRVLTNLGALYMELDDPVRAQAALEQAFELYSEAEDPVGELNALGQLGTVQAAQGDPEAGLRSLGTALDRARELELPLEEASNLEQLANIHVGLGSIRLALELYREANRINRELGLPYEEGANLRAQARLNLEQGNVSLATDQLTRSLVLHREMGARAEELSDLLLLAEAAAQASDTAASRGYMEEAEGLSEELDQLRARVDVAVARGVLAERRGEWDAILVHLEPILPHLAGAPLDLRWRAMSLRARALAETGASGALPVARQAVRLVEALRGTIQSDVLRNGVVQARAETYHLLIELLLQAGDVGAAFVAGDAARSQAVGRRIATKALAAGGDTASGTTQTTEALATRIGHLDAALNRRYRALSGDGSDGLLLREMAEIEEERESILEQLARSGLRLDEGDAPSSGAPEPVDLAVLQARLAQDQTLLSFVETEDEVVVFAVRRDTLAVHRAAVAASDLLSRVRVTRELISDPGARTSADAALASLYTSLLGPLAEPGAVLSGVEHLILVTDGTLTYLPFAALVEPGTGRYLVERFTLSSAPSARTWLALSEAAGQGRGGDDAPLVGVGFAPQPERLPSTAGEVERFLARIPGRGHLGGEATEARLREALASGAVVHAAAHGRMNARNPLFTRLQLAPGTGDPADDGVLHVYEMLEVRSESPLIFLSACETGVATSWTPGAVGGRDLSTLAQALLYGGSPAVVATLWRIEDSAAAEFAAAFYDALARVTPNRALAEAQRQLLAGSRTRAPFFWAAYVLHGDGDRHLDLNYGD